MILKKPYAFFIKMFKPFHILMAILLSYHIYNINNLLGFFSNYLHSVENVVGKNLTDTLTTSGLFLIPIVLILLSLIFLGIMYSKKKPITFYVFCVFLFLVDLIIVVYASNFLGMMEKAVMAIKLVKFNHDLILINMIIEIVYFVLFIVRGLGFNLKKIDFDSDIAKMDISESDKEEFELNINVDFDLARRKRNKRLRQIKYFYKENTFVINSIIIACFIVGFVTLSAYIINFRPVNDEGKIINFSNFNARINNTYIVNENSKGKKINDNYFVLINVSLKSDIEKTSLSLDNFKLQIGDMTVEPNRKYFTEFMEFGIYYNGSVLKNEYNNYLIVFEILEKYINSDLTLLYYDNGNKIAMNLKPKQYVGQKTTLKFNLNDEIKFKEQLDGISFKISGFELKDKYLIKYNYCISENDCILSKEYITPTIDENFDKGVLKINVNYTNNSNLEIKNFYELFSNFGELHYKVNDKWNLQTGNFEELKSKRVSNKNNVFVGVNKNVLNADSVKLVFNIRGGTYEYILK